MTTIVEIDSWKLSCILFKHIVLEVIKAVRIIEDKEELIEVEK